MAEHDMDSLTEVTHFRKIGSSRNLTVPKAVCMGLNWRVGETLLIRAEGNRLIVESLLDHMVQAVGEHEQQSVTRS